MVDSVEPGTNTSGNPIPVTENCPNPGVMQKQEILAAIAKLRAFTCSATGALGNWTAAELAALKAEVETVKGLVNDLGQGDLTQLSQDVQAVRDILAQFDADGDGKIDAVTQINGRLDTLEAKASTLESRVGQVEQTIASQGQTLASHAQTLAQQGQTIQGYSQQLQTLGTQQQQNAQAITHLGDQLTDQICAERRLNASIFEGLGADVDALLAEPCPLPVSVMGVTGAGNTTGDAAQDPSELL